MLLCFHLLNTPVRRAQKVLVRLCLVPREGSALLLRIPKLPPSTSGRHGIDFLSFAKYLFAFSEEENVQFD